VLVGKGICYGPSMACLCMHMPQHVLTPRVPSNMSLSFKPRGLGSKFIMTVHNITCYALLYSSEPGEMSHQRVEAVGDGVALGHLSIAAAMWH